VMGIRKLNQKDGIHPNAAGVKIIARKLAPVVARALAA
jgi:acyl-CoA thioesterase-1